MAYYVLIDGEQAGPFERATVAEMVGRGEVGAETLVWTAGMEDWAPAAGVADLAGLFAESAVVRTVEPGPAAPAPQARAASGPPERLDIARAIAGGLAAFARDPFRALAVAFLYNILPVLASAPAVALLLTLAGDNPEAMAATPPTVSTVVLAGVIVLALIAFVAVLYGGFCAFMIALVRARSAEVALLFTGFRRAGPLIAFALLYTLAVFAGTLALVLPGVFVAIVFVLAPYIIIESELGAIKAMRASWQAVLALGWWRCFIVFVIFIAAWVAIWGALDLATAVLAVALGEAGAAVASSLLQFALNLAMTAVMGAILAAVYEQARQNIERAQAAGVA
jgi:hypothetical protein